MQGFGDGTRGRPRSDGRTWSGWASPQAPGTRGGPDRATLGIIGVVCAVAGFFVLGIILGPAAVVCGWLAMGRTWAGSRPLQAVIAVALGAIDTLVALVGLIGYGAGL
ncbi:small hydrophobic protein [Streptomyces sp. TRM76130]|nr:small hydrophobic protein [Streptomyces sp. TRM76130]